MRHHCAKSNSSMHKPCFKGGGRENRGVAVHSEFQGGSIVDQWLEPLSDPDAPCGQDFEHDNVFLELTQAAQGKPETQFGPGEPADWRKVRELSEDLLERTRDLRVALLWMRACVNLSGFVAVAPGLRLVLGLMENFWDHLHPLPDPDDGDQYPRGNAVAMLPESQGFLGDLRQCALLSLRGTGELRLRAVAIALTQLTAKEDEEVLTKEQITGMMATAIEQDPNFAQLPGATLALMQSLVKLLNDKLGIEAAPDLRPLLELLKGVNGLLPVIEDEAEASDDAADGDAPQGQPRAVSKVALGSVSTRDDALRAIDMVCEYLERTEPTNPAQFLLRRARKLINHNFLQLIKELAPDALNEAARVMGIDPESIDVENSP
jgi:type VI secretion system protein ImpA